MKTQNQSRSVRLAFGALVASLIFSLTMLPLFGGDVEAKNKHRNGHGRNQAQHQAKDNGRNDRAEIAAQKKNKTKKKGSAFLNPSVDFSPSYGSTEPGPGPYTNPLETHTFAADIMCDLGDDDMDNNPQTCGFPFMKSFSRPVPVQIEVVASGNHCSDVQFRVEYRNARGEQNWTSYPVEPGASTGVRDLGDDIEWIAVFAIGHPGGCNTGELANWSATVHVTVPASPSLVIS